MLGLRRHERGLSGAVVSVIVILAGCTTAPPVDEQACSAVAIPLPEVGTSAAYQLSGTLGLWLDTGGAFAVPGEAAGWPPESRKPGYVSFDRGSGQLNVSFGSVAWPVLNGSGLLEPARAVEYSVRPEYGQSLVVLRQWVALDDSNIVQMVKTRVREAPDGDFDHNIRFGYMGRPGILYSSLFWNSTLRLGDSGTLDVPREQPIGLNPAIKGASSGPVTISWEVEGISSDPGTAACVASMRIEYLGLRLPKEGLVRAEFTDGIPLPTMVWEDGAGSQPMKLELEAIRRPLGPDAETFAPWAARAQPARGIATTPAETFVTHVPAWWTNTTYGTAMEMAMGNVEVAAWLDARPEAKQVMFSFGGGQGAGTATDSWKFRFAGNDGESLLVLVWNSTTFLPDLAGPGYELRVSMSYEKDRYAPVEIPPEFVTLDAVAQTLGTAYGNRSVGIFRCDWQPVYQYCSIASFQLRPPNVGLVIDLSTGVLLQEASGNDFIVRTPTEREA